MNRALGVLLGFAVVCNPESARQTVRIYDLARVPTLTLERALRVADRILECAGLQTIWQQGPRDAPEGYITDYSVTDPSQPIDTRGYLVVVITAGPPERIRPELTGYALPRAREGAHAIVFYDRIEKLCLGSGTVPDVGTLLGAAISHELGHVLMRSQEHSPAGLMKARWGSEEYRLLSCNRLNFLAQNKQLIGRSLSPRSTPPH